MEVGPYFFFSEGLFLLPWKEHFNPKTEDMMVAPVWLCLFSLLGEYWDLETLRNIENTLGEFIKIAEQTRIQRYTAFTWIYVYMDLSREIPKVINLKWEDKEWIHPIDYEQLPFRCHLCHEYGHLGRNYPKLSPRNNPSPPSLNKSVKDDGFTQVKNRRWSKGGGKPSARKEPMPKENMQGN